MTYYGFVNDMVENEEERKPKQNQYSKGYEDGYTKAIQDFVTKLKEEKFNGYETLEDYFEDYIECVSVEDIDSIAEKLKKDL